jgi:hypothetical protein
MKLQCKVIFLILYRLWIFISTTIIAILPMIFENVQDQLLKHEYSGL